MANRERSTLNSAMIDCAGWHLCTAAPLSGRALIVASVTGTGLFQLTKWGFVWYVEIARQNLELYCALGGLLFLFVWFYYVSIAFIAEAEFGRACNHKLPEVDRAQRGT